MVPQAAARNSQPPRGRARHRTPAAHAVPRRPAGAHNFGPAAGQLRTWGTPPGAAPPPACGPSPARQIAPRAGRRCPGHGHGRSRLRRRLSCVRGAHGRAENSHPRRAAPARPGPRKIKAVGPGANRRAPRGGRAAGGGAFAVRHRASTLASPDRALLGPQAPQPLAKRQRPLYVYITRQPRRLRRCVWERGPCARPPGPPRRPGTATPRAACC
jgi:hypothetical protein